LHNRVYLAQWISNSNRTFLSHHVTRTRSLRYANTINLLSVARVHTTFASRDFSVAAPQSGTHFDLAFVTLPLPILSVAVLKPAGPESEALARGSLRLPLASASDSATG